MGAGIGVAALGILGLAVVKMALLSGEEARQKRSTVEDLAEIDNYFENIAAMDVDDCGKLFVCQLEAVPAEERSVEEQLMGNLFGESSTIDPAQAKAEYDLAAYLGQATHSKVACARRYQRCPVDRKTIAQALAKMARQPTIKLVINNFFLLFNLILKPPIQYLLTDKHINRMMNFTKTTSTRTKTSQPKKLRLLRNLKHPVLPTFSERC